MRTILLGGLAVALILGGRLTLQTSAAADDAKLDAKKTDEHQHHHHDMDNCIRACGTCAQECESCFAHCTRLVSEGKKEHLRTLRTCVDCGDICALAAKVQSRHGVFSKLICQSCAAACDQCAEACLASGGTDEHMKKCADACKECATACREMIKSQSADVR